MNLTDRNNLFLLLGLAIIFGGAFYPAIILFVDTTPPVYDSLSMTPMAGATYVQLTALQVYVEDPASGVKSVTCTVDGTLYTLDIGVGTDYAATWYKYLSTPVTTSGSHTFQYVFTNYAGLQSNFGGTFTVYRDLQGTWYVNNVAVNGTTQTIYATSTTVPFKFVKSSGVEDSKVTCTASWSGAASGSKTLSLSASNTWDGSVTFSTLGQYSITLKADDGTKQVTFSIVDIDFGTPAPQWNTQYFIIGTGVVLTVFAYMRRKKQVAAK